MKWTLLIGVGLTILISVLWKEEDRRGKRDWENYQRQLKARGETLDWNDFIPPPVPNDQNFFRAPNMNDWFVAPDGQPISYQLLECLSNADMTAKITTRNVANNYLTWSEQYTPYFRQIREALKRPYYRMDGDYTQPYTVPVPNFRTLRVVSEALAQRANCYLVLGQPEKALDEITLLNDLRHLTEDEPSGKPMILVSAMLNVALVTVWEGVVTNGLQSHAWQEPQLISLQKQAEQINLSVFMADALRENRTFTCYYLTTKSIDKIDPNIPNIVRGLLYQNLVTLSSWHQQMIDSINITNNTIMPEGFDRVDNEIDTVFRSSRLHLPIFLTCPYSFIAIVTPKLSTAFKTFAYNQTMVNEAQIACALERYRLAHGEYAKTLDALSPQYMQTIPHDIIGGQPLHYRRTGDGKFLLYSVGWNEVDDGGQPSPRKENGSIDYTNGDWVWPVTAK